MRCTCRVPATEKPSRGALSTNITTNVIQPPATNYLADVNVVSLAPEPCVLLEVHVPLTGLQQSVVANDVGIHACSAHRPQDTPRSFPLPAPRECAQQGVESQQVSDQAVSFHLRKELHSSVGSPSGRAGFDQRRVRLHCRGDTNGLHLSQQLCSLAPFPCLHSFDTKSVP